MHTSPSPSIAAPDATSSSARFSDGVTHLTNRRGLAALHRDAWGALFKHTKIFVGLPVAVWAGVIGVWSIVGAVTAAAPAFGLPLLLLALVLSIIPLGAITFTGLLAVRELGQGRSVEMKPLLSEGWATFKKAFGALFTAGVMSGLASLLFVVPGLVLMTRYILVAPVVVFEGLSGQAAVNRSSDLVKRFGTLRLMAYGFVAWIIYAGMGEIGEVALHYAGVTGVTSLGAFALVIANVPGVIVAAVASIASALLYSDIVGDEALVPYGRSLRLGRHNAKAPTSSGLIGLGAALLIGVLSLSAAVYMPFAKMAEVKQKHAAPTSTVNDDAPGTNTAQ